MSEPTESDTREAADLVRAWWPHITWNGEARKLVGMIALLLAARGDEERERAAKAREALDAILVEPYGCVFCDSGKLRNPLKGHESDCGFALAAAIRDGGRDGK